MLKALKRGETPAATEIASELEPVLAELRTAESARADARVSAEHALEHAAREVAQFLLATASDPRFREALLWQNRVAANGSVASLLRKPPEATDSKTREQRRLVASYLQRYCVKNDTIGFFGPVGWADLTDTAEAVTVRAGPALLAHRHVYFEHWAIDAVARQLARDGELRPYLKPRRMPYLRIEGEALHHPNGKRFDLPVRIARMLAAMDGSKTARELARELLASHTPDLDDEAEVFELLAELEERKVCTWTLEIPTTTFDPERQLRELIAGAEGPARDRAMHALDELEGCRTAVATARDPDALDRALDELESTFERLTGTSATRKGGETYAGRMVVYEDCGRDLQLELGRPILDRLGPPLVLVLASARWYTHEIATRYEQVLRGVYEDLCREHGRSVIELQRLQDRLQGLFPGSKHEHGIVPDVVAELHARWEAILDLGDGNAKSLERRSRDLRDVVATVFRVPGPGWPSARQHSPDVMIAARSVDAIRRGDFRFVLGELHAGVNSIVPCLVKEHPDPERLVRARERDLPRAGIQQVCPRTATASRDFFSTARHDFELEHGETPSGRPRDRVLAIAELVLEDLDGRLVVRTRDGRVELSMIEFLDNNLIGESFGRFRLLGGRAHVPRVAIDELVVQRETWQLAAAAMPFADEPTELGRFLGARRFADRHGIPRMIYAKTDAETKPFFVDLDSPILVEILARNIKRSRRVVISEMAPAIDECWLPDADGHCYTAELRIVATDPIAWEPRR